MRLILLALLLTVPTVGLAQSLGEVAKKEKERRDKNKQQGKKALTFTETEIFGEEEEEGSEGAEDVSTTQTRSTSTSTSSSSSSGVSDDYVVEELEDEGDVPTRIPPDLPMDVRVQMFQRMKAHYERQVREIDEQIAENNETIAELDEQIRTASSSGGAGLPVAPTTQRSDQLYTGQESETLVAEQQKLRTLNERLEERKGELKANVVAQGRIANLPASYLRF